MGMHRPQGSTRLYPCPAKIAKQLLRAEQARIRQPRGASWADERARAYTPSP
jgi:hypothetical protein